MPNVLVGSVTAELLLETHAFDSAIKSVENKVKELNVAFRGTDAHKMAKDITKLEDQLAKTNSVMEEQSKIIDQLKAGYESVRKEADNLVTESRKVAQENNNLTKTQDNIVKANDRVISSFNKFNSELAKTGGKTRSLEAYMNKLLNAMNQGVRADSAKAIKGWGLGSVSAEKIMPNLASIQSVLNQFGGMSAVLSRYGESVKLSEEKTKNFQSQFSRFNPILHEVTANIQQATLKYNSLAQSLSTVQHGYEVPVSNMVMPIEEVVAEMNRLNEEIAQMKAKSQEAFEGLTASMMEWGSNYARYIQDVRTKMGQLKEDYVNFQLLYDGFFAKRPMDSWIKDMEKANIETKKVSTEFIKLKDAMFNADYGSAGKFFEMIGQGATKSGEQIAKLEKEIIAFEQSVGVGSTELQKFSNEFIKLKDQMYNANFGTAGQFFERMDAELRRSGEEIVRFEQRFMQMESALNKGRKFTILQDLVPKDMYGELTRIQEKIAQVSAEEEKLAQRTNKAKAQMEGMSAVTKKLQGAMSSLKMVTSTLSSMFIWTFGMSLYEATKQTVQSKNEMESYLNQMNMSQGSISIFNRGLDDTVSKFRKLNKFMIGETIASIGEEFDLTANQMAKSMDVVAMIQNEYVRAGRKESEASLAVKDILQGEFLRLSRETGVGKQDLIDTGLWQGDLKDVEGLMEALRKVGEDRHWDLFASKCTSLNDVISTTKNRISEFTATLIDELSPIIVEVFNGVIGAVDWLTNSWNNMGGAMQMLVGGGLITGVASAILMIGNNMGLVQIATNGFTNSLVAMALKMDVAVVKEQGLIKTLTMAVTGFNAETSAGLGSVKMLATRILGLDANVVATHGFAKAIAVAKQGLVGEEAMAKASNLTHVKMTTILKETIISWKALKVAILGIMGIGIVAFLGAIAQACARAKESVETFYEVVDNGNELLEDAKKQYESYGDQIAKVDEKMSKLDPNSRTYVDLARQKEKLLRQQSQAYTNIGQIQQANDKAEIYNKQQIERLNGINFDQQERLANVYRKRGYSEQESIDRASKYLNEVEMGNRIINESYDAYESSLISATNHMDAHSLALKNAGADAEQLGEYMEEYSDESYKVAEYWKEFKQGDFWALFKIGLGEVTKMWIDISHHPEVIKLMNNLKQTLKEMKPYIDAVKQGLQGIGMALVDFANFIMSNPIGRTVATFSVLGGTLGLVGLKIASVVTGGKGMWTTFKTLASKVIPSLKDKLKDLSNTAEETGTVLGGGSSKDGKGKGKGKDKKGGMGGKYDMGKTSKGKNSPIYTDWSKTDFKDVAKGDFLDNARNFLKASEILASAMLLVTEAIILINAPMLALTVTGELFKHIEPQVKKGVEGLMTIAPVMAMLLPPVISLMLLMDKFGKALSYDRIADAGLKSAVGIALGLSLVAETIYMIIPSIIALGSLGAVAESVGDNAQKGADAMKLVGEALSTLAPAVPFLIGGIILGIAIFESGVLGVLLSVAVAGGIAIGLLLCAETVMMMEAPLRAIGELGKWNANLDDVKQGAEALKVTGEALKYLDEASSSMVGIAWDGLATWVLTAGGGLKQVADSLTEEDGLIEGMNKFAEVLDTLDIKQIDSAKVESLGTLGDGIKTIGDAIQKVKESIGNFSNTPTASEKYAQATGNQVNAGFDGLQQIYDEFENMKYIIGKISSFAQTINNMEITGFNEGVVSALTSSANGITQVKTAIDNIKSALGVLGDANWESGYASGGIIGAISSYITGGGTGGGDYTSSLGSSLKTLEDAVKDVMKFNSNINSLVSGSGNVSADSSKGVEAVGNAVSVVQSISSVISEIKSTLSSGLTEISSTAKSLGKGIIDGIASGIISSIDSLKSKTSQACQDAGKGVADAFKKGIDPMSSYMNQECTYIGNAIDGKHDMLVQKAGDLAKDMTDAFKKNLEMASPGKMARLVNQEMGYINGFITENTDPIVANIGSLAQTMTENFEPALETQVDINFTSGDVLSDYQTDSIMAMNMANETVTATETAFGQLDYNTGLTFNNIGMTIGNTLTNIANTTKSNYNTVATTTKTQLTNMQSQTTKNIGAIKQSWSEMQVALINSAEHIRSETGAKIHSLQNNMATFWRKVQNPALLLGAGNESEDKGSRTQRFHGRGASIRNVLRPKGLGYAGSPTIGNKSSNPLGSSVTGISDRLRQSGNSKQLDILAEYLKCMLNGEPCYAGGWGFNWSPDIKKALLTWHTHFGEIYDPYLYVGKFENDNFPVRGIAPIALRYIEDAISRTDYDFYYNEVYDPLTAWNRGAFNCMDGARLVIALASAFGFGGGYYGHTSWDGIPHVYAIIPGLGTIDATAIQGGYGLTAGKVSYGAGGDVKPHFKHNNHPSSNNNNNNVGDIHINIDLRNANVTDEGIGERIGKRVREEIIDLISPNDATGY